MKKRSDHEGSFYQYKNRWYGKVSVVSESGKTVRRSVSGKTQKEAIKEAEKVKRLYAARVYQKITLGAWLTRWVDVYLAAKRTSTKETYRSMIKNHIFPGAGHLLLAELRPDDISGLLSGLLEKLSASSVALIYNILSSALRQAVRSEIAYRNIMQAVDKHKVEAVNHQILTGDQIRAFIERIKESRFYRAYLLMLCGGLRRGEALAARWENFSFKTCSISIVETLVKTSAGIELNQPKSKQSKRTVVLPDEILKEFRQVKPAERVGFIAEDGGKPVHPEKIWSDFRTIKHDLCLGSLTMHELRHSHSAHLLRSKIPLSDVSRRLGHSTIKTTADIYAHVVPESNDNAAKAISEILKGKT